MTRRTRTRPTPSHRAAGPVGGQRPGGPGGGAHLAELRRRVPWTQRELAGAAGVSEGTVRAIERGVHQAVRPRVIRALAAALGVPPAAVAEFRPSLGLPPAPPGRAPSPPSPPAAPAAARAAARPKPRLSIIPPPQVCKQ